MRVEIYWLLCGCKMLWTMVGLMCGDRFSGLHRARVDRGHYLLAHATHSRPKPLTAGFAGPSTPGSLCASFLLQVMKFLIAKGANVHFAESAGRSLLIISARSNQAGWVMEGINRAWD